MNTALTPGKFQRTREATSSSQMDTLFPQDRSGRAASFSAVACSIARTPRQVADSDKRIHSDWTPRASLPSNPAPGPLRSKSSFDLLSWVDRELHKLDPADSIALAKASFVTCRSLLFPPALRV
ncbi:hypothetical protein L1887_49922 [Cichorium endivia]|nr:hypothetical protein L1887_49922 [Cichorium endivia]